MRRIAALLAPFVFSGPSAPLPAQALTAGEAFTRIQRSYTATSPADTVDTLKAGDPSEKVTGIATTFLATMDVLREAARRGDNLVITHEPTFYNHLDATSSFTNDAVYQEKLRFIQQHHLVIYRLHDGIHAVQPDHILAGFYQALGWQTYPHPAGPNGDFFVTIPKTTLADLSARLQKTLHDRTLRVEGNPHLAITHVAVLPGEAGLAEQVGALERPDVDLLIAGESAEWETVEYARDAVAQGKPKALILLGHEVSEEPGMERCAEDLRKLFPGLRVDHLSAGQPLSFPQDLGKPHP